MYKYKDLKRECTLITLESIFIIIIIIIEEYMGTWHVAFLSNTFWTHFILSKIFSPHIYKYVIGWKIEHRLMFKSKHSTKHHLQKKMYVFKIFDTNAPFVYLLTNEKNIDNKRET